MSIKPIVLYNENEAALRKESKPVRTINRRVKKLVQDLKDTLMQRDDGIGLAAPQINVHSRVVLVRLGSRDSEDSKPGDPEVLINPEIIAAKNDKHDFDGCLSLPGLYAETVRPHYLRVTGLDEQGNPFERVFEGFDAVLVHHEIDHLDGILFIDRLESVNDLYTIKKDENGELQQVFISPKR